MRQYPPCTVFFFFFLFFFVSRTNIPCTFYSTCCTMPKFSTPHRAQIHCAHHSLNCRMTTHIHIACAQTKFLCALPTLRTLHASLLCVCTPHNAKFITCSCTPTFFRTMPKFSRHTCTLTFFHVAPKFSAHTCTLISCRTCITRFSLRIMHF
jgi:hypothetical protein